MSKTRTLTPEARQRAGMIHGNPSLKVNTGPWEPNDDQLVSGWKEFTTFVCIQERHGKRQLRLTSISQVIYDQGQVGGPWFIRCDGQQLPVSAENAQKIAAMLGLNLEEAKV